MLKISSHNGQISFNENECMKVILSSLAPFLCVYYQLAVVVNQVKAINFVLLTGIEYFIKHFILFQAVSPCHLLLTSQ